MVIPNTKFEHSGTICFRVMLRTNKQTDRQKKRQTEETERRTHAGKYWYLQFYSLKNDTLILQLLYSFLSFLLGYCYVIFAKQK